MSKLAQTKALNVTNPRTVYHLFDVHFGRSIYTQRLTCKQIATSKRQSAPVIPFPGVQRKQKGKMDNGNVLARENCKMSEKTEYYDNAADAYR